MRKPILASLLLAPSAVLASGYSLPNVNPRDLSLSASAVAAQDDAAAAFAMPAGLARLDGPSARLGLGFVNLFNTWKDPLGVQPSADFDLKFTPLPTIFAAYGGRLAALGDRGWGVGAGFDPFGGGAVFWPDGWFGRYRILTVDRKVYSGYLTGGIEVLRGVRLGGGVIYYHTSEKLTQNVCIQCFGLVGAPDAKGTIDLSGGMFSYDLSAEIDPLPSIPLRIAVDYKHKATQDLDGDVSWEGVPGPIALAAPILRNQSAKERLTVPNTLNVGLSYRVVKPLLVMFTYTFDRWVVYDADEFIGSQPGAQLRVPRDYRNGYTLRGGAEYDLTPAIALRAGLQRDVSGLRTSTYSPSLPDASSWAFSAGAGFRTAKGFSVDAGIFYALLDEVKSTENGPEPFLGNPLPSGTLRGTYNPSALIYGVSVGWTPGARSAMP